MSMSEIKSATLFRFVGGIFYKVNICRQKPGGGKERCHTKKTRFLFFFRHRMEMGQTQPGTKNPSGGILNERFGRSTLNKLPSVTSRPVKGGEGLQGEKKTHQRTHWSAPPAPARERGRSVEKSRFNKPPRTTWRRAHRGFDGGNKGAFENIKKICTKNESGRPEGAKTFVSFTYEVGWSSTAPANRAWHQARDGLWEKDRIKG